MGVAGYLTYDGNDRYGCLFLGSFPGGIINRNQDAATGDGTGVGDGRRAADAQEGVARRAFTKRIKYFRNGRKAFCEHFS